MNVLLNIDNGGLHRGRYSRYNAVSKMLKLPKEHSKALVPKAWLVKVDPATSTPYLLVRIRATYGRASTN